MKKKSNVTVQDIAEKVNISASTVSRALNNHTKISQRTKEKVWEAAKQLGYLPNIPVYMQQQKSNFIIFLVDRLDHLENHVFITAAQKIILHNGFQPIIKLVTKDLLEQDLLKSIDSDDVAGVISLLNITSEKEKIYESIVNTNIPLVTTHSTSSKVSQLNILPDLYNGAYLATNHLLTQGAKNIVLISTDENLSRYKDMEDGFKSAMSNSTSKFKILESNLSREALNYEFEQLLNEKVAVDGIITCNNLVACQLHRFLISKNISIPSEVMLISFGNESYLNFMLPSVSTVEYSAENLGITASKEMLELIKNKPSDKKLLVEPVKLIIRTSSMRT